MTLCEELFISVQRTGLGVIKYTWGPDITAQMFRIPPIHMLFFPRPLFKEFSSINLSFLSPAFPLNMVPILPPPFKPRTETEFNFIHPWKSIANYSNNSKK